jgi:hypothetical protein
MVNQCSRARRKTRGAKTQSKAGGEGRRLAASQSDSGFSTVAGLPSRMEELPGRPAAPFHSHAIVLNHSDATGDLFAPTFVRSRGGVRKFF